MSARILVVDDDPAVTDLLAYNLRKAGYEILLAADGREALRVADQSKPDLILLDLMIPETLPATLLMALPKSLDKIESCRAERSEASPRRRKRPFGRWKPLPQGDIKRTLVKPCHTSEKVAKVIELCAIIAPRCSTITTSPIMIIIMTTTIPLSLGEALLVDR